MRAETRTVALVALLLAAAVRPTAAGAAVAHAGQPVMGTVLQVTVLAADEATARSLADAAVAEARRWDDVLTTWRPEGELARLNARAGSGPVEVSSDLAAALEAMRRGYAATGGAFDPAVGPLVGLWRGAKTPSAKELSGLGPTHLPAALLHLDGRRAELAKGAELDAGGIGKGIALDAIAALLRRGGATAAFLDFGGSSQLAIGAPPAEPRGWKLLVAGLRAGEALGVVYLRDAALSTSRASGAGAAAGPIVDPRNGRPVEARRVVTVSGPDATTTEIWSTAMVVLGRAGLSRLSAASAQAVYEDADGVERTSGFGLEPLPSKAD